MPSLGAGTLAAGLFMVPGATAGGSTGGGWAWTIAFGMAPLELAGRFMDVFAFGSGFAFILGCFITLLPAAVAFALGVLPVFALGVLTVFALGALAPGFFIGVEGVFGTGGLPDGSPGLSPGSLF